MPRACPPGRSCARTGSSVAAQKGVAGSMLAAPPRRTSHLVARSKATISTSVNMSAGLLTWLICGGLCLIGCWVSTRRAAAAPHGEPPPPSIYACASPGSPGLHPLRPPLPVRLSRVRRSRSASTRRRTPSTRAPPATWSWARRPPCNHNRRNTNSLASIARPAMLHSAEASNWSAHEREWQCA